MVLLLLAVLDPASVAAPVHVEEKEVAPRRLVFTSFYGLGWSLLSAIPSGQLSLFLGSSLRPLASPRMRGWKSALGYELGVSVGAAERATSFYSFGGDYGLVYHRHHLTALGHGGPGDRLYYQFSGGLLMWRTTPVALEAQTRLGVVVGTKRPGRVRGVVGAEVRIVGVLGGVPMPHFGVFAGVLVF